MIVSSHSRGPLSTLQQVEECADDEDDQLLVMMVMLMMMVVGGELFISGCQSLIDVFPGGC